MPKKFWVLVSFCFDFANTSWFLSCFIYTLGLIKQDKESSTQQPSAFPVLFSTLYKLLVIILCDWNTVSLANKENLK